MAYQEFVYESWYFLLYSIGTRFLGEDQQEKNLPCLTICPWNAFKHRGFFYKSGEFIEETFECKDIFLHESFCDHKNQTLFDVEEIKSIFLGRCYMTCLRQPVQKKQFVTYYIKNNQDATGQSALTTNH